MLASALARGPLRRVEPIISALGHLRPAQVRAIARAQPSRTVRAYSSASDGGAPAVPTEKTSLKAHFGPRPARTHTTSDLSPSLLSSRVVLAGWLVSFRSANARLAFITLKDAHGVVQLVCSDPDMIATLREVPLESVVQVEGGVQQRVKKAKGKEGVQEQGADEVEVLVDRWILLNPARDLPFYPNHPELANEDLRAQHRYLDLRRDALSKNIRTRSRITQLIRSHLHAQGFNEVETPVLLQSSPEGAREFLVPARVPPGADPAFYALPQSPQQPKQLLIASGAVDRYFQIAKCFRDEGGRKDRQPEFTQVDIEMGFVSGAAPEDVDGMRSTWRIGGGEVRELVEGLVKRIWKEFKGVDLPGWFRVMPYDVAMDVYGSDKPDTRFAMYTLPISYYPSLSDADLDRLIQDEDPQTVEYLVIPAEQVSAIRGMDTGDALKAVESIDITHENALSWPAESELARGLKLVLDPSRPGGAQAGDRIYLAKRKRIPEGGWTKLGRLRTIIRDRLVAKGALELPSDPHFLWVTEFPLFTHADDDKEFLAQGRWSSTHHPFTAPMWEDMGNLKAGKEDMVRGQHYDLVLNGMEIGGGSVRIHDAELQTFVLKEVLELEDAEMQRFGHLLQALKFGAPPHAGIALGLDRLVSIICDTHSIRDVIAFPKTGGGIDPVFKSPSPAPKDSTLAEYGLRKA